MALEQSKSNGQNSIASLAAIRERPWRLSKIALGILCLDRSIQRPQSAFGATVLTRAATCVRPRQRRRSVAASDHAAEF
ncbi:hypothetical protein CAMGR0001_2064 [Campylobacter gracilis RM3268]|uniref:Uncharacterized protein n=1 Tax=Campylobacter gracilis RM3268 TaxID=553220 RepID=C8PLQ3_9BACT|nr:hypothetical protein CAMGR0001_2064 [Campylobacter gracilis RM3268]